MYVCMYVCKSVRLVSVKQCSIHVSRAEYKVEKKIQTDYTFISTSLFRGCPLVRRFMYVCMYVCMYVKLEPRKWLLNARADPARGGGTSHPLF